MLSVQIKPEAIRIGDHFTVSFKRTLRIPDDGKEHKPPPNFGVFPVYRVEDHAERLPAEWSRDRCAFIPMYQCEALYLRFDNETPWQPHAVSVGVGNINAVSGEPSNDRLRDDPQDYLVCPPQLWLDGINTGQGTISQFVAMPLGEGYTVEGSLTGNEEFGGLQITVFPAKPGIFPDTPPEIKATTRPSAFAPGQVSETSSMGLGAGGTIKQKVLPDPHGLETWDENNLAHVTIHILNSTQFKKVTGLEPPPTTVDEETYAELKFPWFPLYGEILQGDVAPSELLAEAKTVRERDAEREKTESRGNRS